MQVLEKRIHTENPLTIDACAHADLFKIQSQVKIPCIYGGPTEVLLERIITAKHVDFVCDTLNDTPSIKYASHVANASDLDYCISGPEQKTPINLVLSKFKRFFLTF